MNQTHRLDADHPKLCDPENWAEVQALIEYAISPDVSYSQSTTDLRNHRVFAIRVKSSP